MLMDEAVGRESMRSSRSTRYRSDGRRANPRTNATAARNLSAFMNNVVVELKTMMHDLRLIYSAEKIARANSGAKPYQDLDDIVFGRLNAEHRYISALIKYYKVSGKISEREAVHAQRCLSRTARTAQGAASNEKLLGTFPKELS